jgi:quinohemoprotein ethanol dehydrogenase
MGRKRRFRNGFLDVGIWLLFFVLLLPAAVVGYAIGNDDEEAGRTVTVGEDGKPIVKPTAIQAAPAFSADDLTAEPTDHWITNGGTLSNQRYSPLDEIDTDNVAQLKGVWMTSLKRSGTAAKYSAEAQPIVYQGTMYVPTGADDVFAIDVGTGKIVWEYNAHLEQTISTVCCGWLSRGVAIGDGKVYLGQLDGKLVALDQKTGKVAWTTAVGRWQDGFTLTHAPLYYDGMVIVGGSGGEFSLRGRVAAFDARTGKLKWRFWTIPGPGETGHDTWPQDSDAWKTGGAPVWQTPALDPALGLIYFSTGNASPDLNGSKRDGDNLFTASIVAVDARTGKYRWHYQQVHHDIWDYDGPSPVVLFDLDGKKGLAQASKTGWLYLLDRETGEPLLPISEKPVPQLAAQKTAKTQPIPSYPPFIPHEVTAKHIQAVKQLKKANKALKNVPVKGAKEMYTPFDDKAITVVVPGPQGGTNWQPTSYSPETEMFYVCAQAAFSGLVLSKEGVLRAKQGSVADIGGSFVTTGFGDHPGFFTAIDARTGEIKWQKRWPESCYSGSTATAGGLVFVGRNSGQLEAYDAENGERKWSFQTGAGANSTVTVFEQGGTEKIAFLAGGNALAATPHGDNLWLFALDGTMEQLEGVGEAAEGVGHAGETPTEPTTGGDGDATAGKAVWADNCSGCHGLTGMGGNGGPDLTSIPTASNPVRVHAQVKNGGGGMPSFQGTLTQQEIEDVTAFVVKDITGGG